MYFTPSLPTRKKEMREAGRKGGRNKRCFPFLIVNGQKRLLVMTIKRLINLFSKRNLKS